MSEEENPFLSRVFSPRKRRVLGVALLVIVAAMIWKGVETARNMSGDREIARAPVEKREIVTQSDYARESSAPSLRSDLAPLSIETGSRNAGRSYDEPILRATPVGEEGVTGPNPKWSDAALRLGFSFFAAMVIGSFLRTFVKTMTVVLVVGGVLYWFLVKQGIIQPMLYLDQGFVDASRTWLGEQSRSAIDFMKGELPSTAAAAVGLFLGMRK